jgi:DHA3 family multidrug efflux protein-like MFS transporter
LETTPYIGKMGSMPEDGHPEHTLSKQKVFYHVLANTLFASVINFTIWFAITFYAYIQTKSVFVTGMIAGVYLIATMLTGIWFGSLVDHHKKRTVMAFSSVASLFLYAVSLAVYLLTPESTFQNAYHPMLWLFIVLLLVGVIAGNIRTIALPTLVTILIPATRRDKANGMVGTVSGVSFLVTSVISGLLVAAGGMLYALILGIVVTVAAIIHLLTIQIPEKGIAHAADAPRKVDLKGTYKVILAIPGMLALILFSTFNNFLGGVFMALMDAYGLSLVSVQAWGLLWGVLSAGLIIGGLLVAKRGLGKNPVRALLLVNVILWIVCILFPLHGSIVPLAVGMLIYMLLIPFAEASEQTIMQRVVPYERQGRVFGFAQSVEQAASPLTAFLIGPLTQFIFIPLMTTGIGADLIGGWFGTGAARGMAIVFIITGIIGLIATLLALRSRYYRQLSTKYLSAPATPTEAATPAV